MSHVAILTSTASSAKYNQHTGQLSVFAAAIELYFSVALLVRDAIRQFNLENENKKLQQIVEKQNQELKE